MLRFYFRKTHFEVNYGSGRFHQFGDLGKRRIKRLDYWNLAYALWFWMFLEFAAKIGFVSIAPFGDLGSYYAVKYSEGIDVPKAENVDRLPTTRHVIFVSLDCQGNLKMDDAYCTLNILKTHIAYLSPVTVVCLIVDKNVEMEKVNKILSAIRESGPRHVNFLCRSSSKQVLNH